MSTFNQNPRILKALAAKQDALCELKIHWLNTVQAQAPAEAALYEAAAEAHFYRYLKHADAYKAITGLDI
jgi:hypothetical protein